VTLFLLYKSLVMIMFFHFRLGWISLLNHVFLFIRKMLWKKNYFFFIVFFISNSYFFIFLYLFFKIYWDWVWLRSRTQEEYIKLGPAQQDPFKLGSALEGPKIARLDPLALALVALMGPVLSKTHQRSLKKKISLM
jgi:hypothetical protein